MTLRRRPTSRIRPRAFTLLEVLVVVGVVALLTAMLLPTLGRAREHARSVLCRTNLAGLARANEIYAGENAGRYVPAASDIFWGSSGNRHRWHGARANLNSPFDPAAGPLAKTIGGEGKIKQCPSFTDYRADPAGGAYECGSGGYGYSDVYVGSTFWEHGFYHDSPGQLLGCRSEDVRSPAETVMFADAAMPVAGRQGRYYVEESFAYCVFGLDEKGNVGPFRREPSVHFRHYGHANVVWCDAHAAPRDDFHSVSTNVYGADPKAMAVGWFGPDDNSLFDLD